MKKSNEYLLEKVFEDFSKTKTLTLAVLFGLLLLLTPVESLILSIFSNILGNVFVPGVMTFGKIFLCIITALIVQNIVDVIFIKIKMDSLSEKLRQTVLDLINLDYDRVSNNVEVFSFIVLKKFKMGFEDSAKDIKVLSNIIFVLVLTFMLTTTFGIIPLYSLIMSVLLSLVSYIIGKLLSGKKSKKETDDSKFLKFYKDDMSFFENHFN